MITLGSYIDLRRCPQPSNSGFKPIPLTNEWERRICDSWRSDAASDLQEWLQHAISDVNPQKEVIIEGALAKLSQAIERKVSPIFFIMDIRALISHGVFAQ